MSDTPAFDMPPVSAGFDARGGWLLLRLMADLSLTAEQAAGIVGTLAAESGLQAIQERGQIAPRGGFGWEQATGPRRASFYRWAADHDMSVTDDAANYGFMLDELNGSEAHALERLRQTTTVDAATETFVKQFERPADPDKETARAIPFAKRALVAAFPKPSPNFPIPLEPAPWNWPRPPIVPPAPVPSAVATPAVTSGIVAGGVSAVAMMFVEQAVFGLSLLHITVPDKVAFATTIGLATLFGWFLRTRLAKAVKLDQG